MQCGGHLHRAQPTLILHIRARKGCAEKVSPTAVVVLVARTLRVVTFETLPKGAVTDLEANVLIGHVDRLAHATR